MKPVTEIKTAPQPELPKEILKVFETLARWKREEQQVRPTGQSRTVNLKIVKG